MPKSSSCSYPTVLILSAMLVHVYGHSDWSVCDLVLR